MSLIRTISCPAINDPEIVISEQHFLMDTILEEIERSSVDELSNHEKLQNRLTAFSLDKSTKKALINDVTELQNAKPESLYRNGIKMFHPKRGNAEQSGDNAPFYESPTIPAPEEVYNAVKHKNPFECYLNGRGDYYKFGPNGSGDFCVTFAVNKTTYCLFINRKKENKFAMPGGMNNDCESFIHAALREFFEEAYAGISVSDKEILCSLLLNKGILQCIYEGIMDDSRNTNQAFGYSSITNAHFEGEEAEFIMALFDSKLNHCQYETSGACIVELTPDFIESHVWSTHHAAIKAVYAHHAYVPA
jgi:hypothetical protein